MTRTRPQARRQQRWPDVMIGVLTLALLGGFGALLLDQRKPAATATETAPTQAQPTATATSPSIPASPGTVAPTETVTAPSTPDTTATGATPAQTAQNQTPQSQTAQGQAAAGQATTATPADTTSPTGTASATPGTTDAATATAPATTSGVAQTTEIPPVPKAPDVAPITPPTGVTPQQQQANQQQAGSTDTASTATDSGTATGTSVAPRSGGAVATSEDRTPLRSDYRISLGSFGTQATVGTQTANVKSLGYTIHSIDLGNQYVAQVGPFADEATARQALADIQRAYPGALLYRPRGAAASPSTSDSDTSTSSTSSSDRAASTDSDRSGRTSEASAAPAPSGPTYLQVGAFDRVDSAQKLVGQLRDAGFAPTVNNPPDRKTTVLVGPYSGDALVRAENRLNTAGLDHFRVR